jgi:excisionase family DNA binding protein
MLKAAAVAQQLGISQRAVYDLAAGGRLACYRLGPDGGAVRFDQADVDTYKASCRSAGTPETSAGASSSTATFKASATGLLAYFQRAGVKPRLTPTTGRKAGASTQLRLASSSETP